MLAFQLMKALEVSQRERTTRTTTVTAQKTLETLLTCLSKE